MYITPPPPKTKTIEDYDFTFDTGLSRSISIDKEAGDTVDFTSHPVAVQIHLSPKPSTVNFEVKSPPEDITVFIAKLLSIDKRTREVEDLTYEQKAQWTKTFQEMSNTTIQ